MTLTGRQLLVGLSSFVFLGLLLRLLSASPAGSVTTEQGPEGGTTWVSVPWERFRNPSDDVVRVSQILDKKPSSTKDKLNELSRLESEAADSPLIRGLVKFAQGVVLLRAGRPQDAAERFLSPSIDQTELTGWSLYFASRGMADASPREAIEVLERLVSEHPDFALLDNARLRLGRLLVRQRKREEASQVFRQVLDSEEDDGEDRERLRGEALFELARVLVDLGQYQEAARLLARLYYEMPTHTFARDAGRTLTSLRRKLPGQDAERSYRLAFERAERLYEANRYKDAYNAYTQLRDRFKKQVDLDFVNLRRGVCMYHRRQRRTAEKILRQVERADLKPEALYYQGLAAERLRKRTTHQLKMAEVLTLSPDSPWAEEALWSLARHYLGEDEEAALHNFQRIANEFPNGKYYVQAQWRVLWAKYLERQYAEVAVELERVARENPAADELPQLLYWGARAYESSGRIDRAEALYRQTLYGFKNTYYGRRAEEHLVLLGGEQAALAALEEGRKGIDLSAALGVYHSDRESRIGQLLAMGLYEEASREAASGRDGEESDPAFLATMAWIRLQQGHVGQAIGTMRQALPFHISATGDLLPREIWKVLYPLRYWDIVQRYSHEKGLDPFLVAGLIRQESTFNARVRSRAGARGLMQIMPATGKKIAREQRRRYRSNELYDPEVNIRFGTHYLRKILDSFGGRIDYALASYNAGPHRVKRWTGGNYNLDPEEFIENIPFTETRNYVKLVLRNEALYRRIYVEGPAAVAALEEQVP